MSPTSGYDVRPSQPAIKYVYMQNVMFVGVSVIEILEFQPEDEEEEHGKTMKYHITSITPVLQDFLNIISQHVLYFDGGRS